MNKGALRISLNKLASYHTQGRFTKILNQIRFAYCDSVLASLPFYQAIWIIWSLGAAKLYQPFRCLYWRPRRWTAIGSKVHLHYGLVFLHSHLTSPPIDEALCLKLVHVPFVVATTNSQSNELSPISLHALRGLGSRTLKPLQLFLACLHMFYVAADPIVFPAPTTTITGTNEHHTNSCHMLPPLRESRCHMTTTSITHQPLP